MNSVSETYISGKLKTAIVTMLPKAVVFKHSDYATVGIPDFSVTFNLRTIWLEVKSIGPDGKFIQRGLQHDTCLRLANISHCWYVVYSNAGHGKRTHLASPHSFDPKQPETHPWLKKETSHYPGYDHVAVAHFVKQVLAHDYDRP